MRFGSVISSFPQNFLDSLLPQGGCLWHRGKFPRHLPRPPRDGGIIIKSGAPPCTHALRTSSPDACNRAFSSSRDIPLSVGLPEMGDAGAVFSEVGAACLRGIALFAAFLGTFSNPIRFSFSEKSPRLRGGGHAFSQSMSPVARREASERRHLCP